MTAHLLSLTEAGRLVGLGLVAVEARFCSVRWFAADRLDRRFVAAKDWPVVEGELSGFDAVPLPPSSAVVRVLAGDRLGLVVSRVTELPITADDPAGVAGALDRVLLDQPMTAPTTPVH